MTTHRNLDTAFSSTRLVPANRVAPGRPGLPGDEVEGPSATPASLQLSLSLSKVVHPSAGRLLLLPASKRAYPAGLSHGRG